MNEQPTARQLEELGFAHHSVSEIIVEGFKLIRKLDTDANFRTFDVWAPSVAHNVLYASCLDCLCGGTTAYIQDKKRVTKKDLKKVYGVDFVRPCPDNFLLHSRDGASWKYPKSHRSNMQLGSTIVKSKYVKTLSWHDIELPHRVLETEADHTVSREEFKAIGFWKALTRVQDGTVYMARYMNSKPLVLQPEEVNAIEFLVNQLRNPVAHVQPNASALWGRDQIRNAVMVAQRATLFLTNESNMSITLDHKERKRLVELAI